MAVGIVALVVACLWGTAVGHEESDLLFYACAFAQAALCVLAARLAVASGSRLVLAILVGGAVLVRLWLVFTPPTLSIDLYRYIWDGRVVNAGFNPYLHVPNDPALLSLRDPDQFGMIDKRDYAVTIYPPVAQALFAVVTRLSGAVWAMKLAMVLVEGVAVLAIARLLARLGRPAGLLAVYLLHPGPIWEISGNGHVDAATMALVFGAFAFAGGAARPYRSALVLTLAALVKPLAALGLPAVWRPLQIVLPLFVLAVAAACYLPFANAGTGVIGFLPNYLHEQALDSGEGLFVIVLLRHLGLAGLAMPTAYGVVAAIVVLGLAVWTRRRARLDLAGSLSGTALLLLVALVLLSPIYPWYFLITAPFIPLLGWWSPFVLATGGFLLYGFHPDQPEFFTRWSVLMGLVVAALVRDLVWAWPADPGLAAGPSDAVRRNATSSLGRPPWPRPGGDGLSLGLADHPPPDGGGSAASEA